MICMQATFGAGCFWCVEDVFRQVKGVKSTTVGYAGGWKENPTYEEVCTDTTGHAEVVKVEYDPETISYKELLDVFWRSHDPTTLNRQGPDIGTQYRSVIFYYSKEQEMAARQTKSELENSSQSPKRIVTEILPAGEFYEAEEYHQQYYEKCSIR
jgi:peptide-methionine (S)-S-oxide reductase